MKTSELIGPALDWAAASITHQPVIRAWVNSKGATIYLTEGLRESGYPFRPQDNPNQGQPLLETNKISVWWHEEYDCWCAASRSWMNADVETEDFATMQPAYRGETMLIAGLRCLVASHLGEDVEIPEELL